MALMPKVREIEQSVFKNTATKTVTMLNSRYSYDVKLELNYLASFRRGLYRHDDNTIVLYYKNFVSKEQVISKARHEFWHAVQWKTIPETMQRSQEFMSYLGDHTEGIAYLLYWLNPVEIGARHFESETRDMATNLPKPLSVEARVQEYQQLLQTQGVCTCFSVLLSWLDEEPLAPDELENIRKKINQDYHNEISQSQIDRLGLHW